MKEIIYVLLSGFVGSIVTLVISFFYNKKKEDWNRKYQILYKLVAFRGELGSNEFKSSFNSIDVVYYNSPKVLAAKKEFYEYVISPKSEEIVDQSNEKLINILMSMFDDLKINKNIDYGTLEAVFTI